ncbi:N-acetyltransferase [Methanofollis aquaemaris]|uniref:N-acetyltransferase n=1 Tax=Methanofollis aquaemaris TaxID=126734 RepID=A0A8A3S415_9EURY|nr:GNAT family protein [Methanofollis aquaemaris]QSZ66354.1 N-acetyltransferase [Methanofollis aquaemaris]
MKPPLCIRTKSASLRPWEIDDAPALARHANNPDIAGSMRDGFPSPYTLNDAENFIHMASGTSSAILLAIEVDGEAVGGIGVTPLDDVYRNTAEIGYWLAAPYQGRGIVTEAVKALVPVAFERLDVLRIQAGIFENNCASARVLEKCGFQREAMHKKAITKNGTVMDEVIYACFRDE